MSNPVRVVTSADRMPRLDGLRGIAIIMVMFFHLAAFPPHSRLDHLFERITQYGWTGVDLFFILSGFLITGILLDARDTPNYFRNFYVRRALRILPLYYGFVLALIFIYPLAGAHFRAERNVLLQNETWIWTHTVNWLVMLTGDFTSRTTLGVGGFWSLAIEEQYYLMWPALVLLLSRRALLRTCLALTIFSIIARFLMAEMGCTWAAIYSATFARFDPLAIGGALAVAARSAAGLRLLRKPAWITGSLALGGLLLVDLAIHHLRHNNEVVLATQLTLLPVLWGSSLVLTQTAATSSLIAIVTQTRLLRSFGKYSYSLYLFHGHLIIFPEGLGYKFNEMRIPRLFGSILPAQLLWLALTFGLCFGLSWLCWHLYEVQFLKLKRYFPSGKATPPRERPRDENPVVETSTHPAV